MLKPIEFIEKHLRVVADTPADEPILFMALFAEIVDTDKYSLYSR